MSKSIVWKPSRSPRIRNSASPCSPGAQRSTSSSVPGSPSGPTPRTGMVSGWVIVLPSRSSSGKRQRVVGRSRDQVVARRQLDRPGDVPHAEAQTHGGPVRHEELGREELLQVADVARDDDHARDADLAAAARQRGRARGPAPAAHPSPGRPRRAAGTIVGNGGRSACRVGGDGGGQMDCGIGTPWRSKATGKVRFTAFDSSFRPSVNSKRVVVVAVEDDALLADLVEGERPRLHGGHQHLLDDFMVTACGVTSSTGRPADSMRRLPRV